MEEIGIHACVLRIEGTNCEEETALALKRLGAKSELVHLKQLADPSTPPSRRRSLDDYQLLIFPGGFSAGDYVRAGAIFASRIRASLRTPLVEFVRAGKPVLGICNGFQVLVELGILPGFEPLDDLPETPDAVLAPNDSGRFECRPTFLRHENRGLCVFTTLIPMGAEVMFPSAHAEGKLLFGSHLGDAYARLEGQDQLVFRYARPGSKGPAGYPYNPNGSPSDVAGICNCQGTVMGLMPHPERVFFRHQHPRSLDVDAGVETDEGDGRAIFRSAIDYAARF